MNFSHLLMALLVGAFVSLASGAEASRHFAAPVFSPLSVQAGLKCELVDGKLVCEKKTKSGQNDDDGDDNGDDEDTPKKSNDKKIPKNCKKARCEPGMVVLDKPNKYGACCEAREGLPPPKQQEAEKCKFPGEVGTPPNCSCPPGTEFLGYRGCVKWTIQRANCELVPNKPGAYVRQDSWEDKRCVPLYGKDKSRGSCLNYQGSSDPLQCCCEVKVYEK